MNVKILSCVSAPKKTNEYAVDIEVDGIIYTFDILKTASQVELEAKIKTMVTPSKPLPNNWVKEFEVI